MRNYTRIFIPLIMHMQIPEHIIIQVIPVTVVAGIMMMKNGSGGCFGRKDKFGLLWTGCFLVEIT